MNAGTCNRVATEGDVNSTNYPTSILPVHPTIKRSNSKGYACVVHGIYFSLVIMKLNTDTMNPQTYKQSVWPHFHVIPSP